MVCDKGYAGREFGRRRQAARHRTSSGPPAATSPTSSRRFATIRQRIESVFQTCKDLLNLERHGARTQTNLRARIGIRLLALGACIDLNHQLGRPSRALANYTA